MRSKTKIDEGPEASLSVESQVYLRQRPKSERASLGQFLTPRLLREELVAQIPLRQGMRVLDPGVGTGEFLRTCLKYCDDLEVAGWDVDPPALEVAKTLVPRASLELRSALDEWQGENFDVVIGNPPYFEMRNLSPELKRSFQNVISGRPNIFALFFDAAFRVLKVGGYLGFVVPPSMNNGAYFERLREFILANFSIEFLKVFDDPFLFDDAQTAVQLIVLKKGERSDNHWVDLGKLSGSPARRRVFVGDKTPFTDAFQGMETLYSLGYQAITGSIVWNTRKKDLCRSSGVGTTPLIWAHNISAEVEVVLHEDHPKRPQYIRNVKELRGPAIVVNRITGSVGSGSLRCAFIPEGMEFVGENHVNVIVPRQDCEQKASWQELLAALRDPAINGRVRALTGNTQISATELTNWIPLCL
jgi:adenine-specific DNA-methyltransferase